MVVQSACERKYVLPGVMFRHEVESQKEVSPEPPCYFGCCPGADASSAKEAGRRGHFDRLVHRVIFHLCRAHLGRRLALEGVENIFLGLSWLLSPESRAGWRVRQLAGQGRKM